MFPPFLHFAFERVDFENLGKGRLEVSLDAKLINPR